MTKLNNENKFIDQLNDIQFDLNYETAEDMEKSEIDYINELLDGDETPLSELKNRIFSDEANAIVCKKKVMIDDKIRKRVRLVNDYLNFYALPQKNNLGNLYVYTKEKEFKSKKFQQLRINTITFDFKPTKVVNLIEDNPILKLCSKRKAKRLILLNPSKGGFKAWYKGAIGLIDKRTAFVSMIDNLDWAKIFFAKKSTNINANIIDSNLSAYFPVIKNNFSKTKKRKINFTEINLTFLDKKYAKDRKEIKTKADRRTGK